MDLISPSSVLYRLLSIVQQLPPCQQLYSRMIALSNQQFLVGLFTCKARARPSRQCMTLPNCSTRSGFSDPIGSTARPSELSSREFRMRSCSKSVAIRMASPRLSQCAVVCLTVGSCRRSLIWRQHCPLERPSKRFGAAQRGVKHELQQTRNRRALVTHLGLSGSGCQPIAQGPGPTFQPQTQSPVGCQNEGGLTVRCFCDMIESLQTGDEFLSHTRVINSRI